MMKKAYTLQAQVFDILEKHDNSCITALSANLRCVNKKDEGKNNWYYRAPFMIRVISEQAPDIIGFQECMNIHYDYLNTYLKGYESVIEYREKGRHPESCPIFWNTAKFDFIGKGSFWLSKTPEKISKDWGSACYRICSYAILKQKSDGRELAVFNTHLDHISEEARINGIKLILEKLVEFGGMPCIIMGDFNDVEGSETYKKATELFLDAKHQTKDSDDGATYQDFGRQLEGRSIDFFFISKTGIAVSQFKIIRTTYDGVYPSDHFPIILKFRLN